MALTLVALCIAPVTDTETEIDAVDELQVMYGKVELQITDSNGMVAMAILDISIN